MSRLSNLKVCCGEEKASIHGFLCQIPHHIFIREITPRGSNGIVFEGYDRILERKVAIKIWIPSQIDLRDRKQQALHEAKKLGQLSHPNIVQIYSCDELPNGWIYTTMELLEGSTLRDYLLTEKPDFITRLRIWHEIEDAIDYSHKREVYHGDLHDKNVQIIQGKAKVIDFGTSIFTTKNDQASRETKMILELSQKMFITEEPRLDQITDLDIYSLKPELALCVASTWVAVLFGLKEFERVFSRRGDDDFYREMQSLAFEMTKAPVLSWEKMVDYMKKNKLFLEVKRVGIPTDTITLFLDCCISLAKSRINYVNDERVSLHVANFNRAENEGILKDLWPKFRSIFISSGPF